MSEPIFAQEEHLPLVTVIVPCRDEAAFIGTCLESIVAGDYPRNRLEVLVVDGSSTDGTREIVDAVAARYPFIRLIDNPERITPVALNRGIREAQGEYIVWMSAHNAYSQDYLTESVRWARRSGADNVGGMIVTRPRTMGPWSDAVTAVLTHPFGVGGSAFRVHSSKPVWVDTVFGGCYRRDVFDRIGLFNEKLRRGQDMEFNLRLQRAGGRTLLVPSIRSEYYARTAPLEFLRHTWLNGEWAILPFLYSDGAPVAIRHLVPLAFASALVAGIVAGAMSGQWWMLMAIVLSYAAFNIAASVHVSAARRRPVLLLVAPLAFAMLHLVYGFGSVSGFLRLVALRLTGYARR